MNYTERMDLVDVDDRWAAARSAEPVRMRGDDSYWAALAGYWDGVARAFLGKAIGAEAGIVERDAEIARLEIMVQNMRNDNTRRLLEAERRG